jgi:D-alanine-D-alanine ligase
MNSAIQSVGGSASSVGKTTTNPQDFGRVGLLVGGDSAERAVSLDGGVAVLTALQRQEVNVELYDGGPALIKAVIEGQVDRVFNLIHGPGGEDGAIQGALQLLNIPITGAGLLGSALSMDKVHSNWVWEQQGIKTPPFTLVRDQQEVTPVLCEDLIAQWGLPLFVKPAGLGSSIGITKVENADELPAAIDLAHSYSKSVIVEPEVKGKEYFAGIVGDLVLPLIRISTPNKFYDYAAKYESDETQYFCPCGLSEEVESAMQALSLEAFQALDCSGWGRIDFILDNQGTPWFLEANTTPGMTSHSLVPQAAAKVGINFDQLVWRILESSL